MISRYSRKKISNIWEDSSKYDLWLKIELLVCEAWNQKGKIPDKSLDIIKKKAGYDLKRIAEIEKEVKHDVIAFLTSVAEFIGPDSRFIHLGLTSSDLLDTTFSCQLVAAGNIIKLELETLISNLKEQAYKYKDTPQIGRTHGIHAEPITFGLKLTLWYEEFKRHLRRLEYAIEDISVGKISGAVGTFAHLDPEIETYVCDKLNIKPASVSSQIIQRDRHAHFFTTLACIASSIEKIALEIRHLQRTEVMEVCEPFSKGQKGSSAMPHKRNPILCENITGLARIVRTNSFASLENIALWHERDISHSSVERIIAPDSTILVDFMLARLNSIIKDLDVYPENMKRNLDINLGLYASQHLLLELVDAGLTREEGYRIVQESAMKAWNEKKELKLIIKENSKVTKVLKQEKIDKVFDIKNHLKNIDTIFKRVFS